MPSKHIRYKKAAPKNSVRINFIDPATNKRYATERMLYKDFTQLCKHLSVIYGVDYSPKKNYDELIERALSDIKTWLPEVFGDVNENNIKTN